VKKGSLPEAPDVGPQRVVVLCGDISPHRRFFSDTAGITLIRCTDAPDKTIPLLRQLNASLLVARQRFLEQLPEAAVSQITSFGKGCSVLAILDGGMLEAVEEASVIKMLRLGCRGVLPRRFSSKLFRRAVFALLKGELWAPPALVSELLSELLRAASLKSERGLTPQEARILELSLQGFTNSAIADALFISLGTVRWHKRRLNRKLKGAIQPRYPQTKAAASRRAAVAG